MLFVVFQSTCEYRHLHWQLSVAKPKQGYDSWPSITNFDWFQKSLWKTLTNYSEHAVSFNQSWEANHNHSWLAFGTSGDGFIDLFIFLIEFWLVTCVCCDMAEVISLVVTQWLESGPSGSGIRFYLEVSEILRK